MAVPSSVTYAVTWSGKCSDSKSDVCMIADLDSACRNHSPEVTDLELLLHTILSGRRLATSYICKRFTLLLVF